MQDQWLNRSFKLNFKTIIWDWNGTLLNDLTLCVNAINTLLEKRGLPLLNNVTYREMFSFPVKDYYEKVGFDFSKEPFSVPAQEFINIYNLQANQCRLHSSAIPTLQYFRSQSISQFVLSATKQDMLDTALQQNGISHFFKAALGLNNHYAVSKIERGKELLDLEGVNKGSTCIIGDTIHDFEVATELGIQCILIADGHQSKQRLLDTGATVLNSLGELAVLTMGFSS